MSKYNLGLSNPYLKLGLTLFLVGVASMAGAFFLEAPGFAQQLGLVLFTGIVVHVIGRIAKAVSSSGK